MGNEVVNFGKAGKVAYKKRGRWTQQRDSTRNSTTIISCRILGSRTQRCQETGWLAADMRWLDPWYKESLRHPVLESIKLKRFEPSNTSPGTCSNLPVLFVHPG